MKRPSTIPSRLVSPALLAASVVVALGTPVATANAQFSLQGSGAVQSALSLDQFKQKITSAIDTSVTKLQQTADSLNLSLNVQADKNGVTVNGSGPAGTASGTVNKDGATGQANGKNGSSASGSVTKDGAQGQADNGKGSSASGNVSSSNTAIDLNGHSLAGLLSVPKDLIKKLQDSNKKAIDKLKNLKTQVEVTASMPDLQAKAKEFDQEFKEIATANVQASVTKSIDSMTRVLDHLQSASSSIQSRVSMLKDCVQKGSAQAEAHANASGTGSSASAALKCADLNVDVNSGDAGASLQEKLDEVKSSLQTIKSFLSSSISLVAQLKEGNYTGTIKSFNGISAQVDIAANLSSDVQNDLLNLSAAVNKS